MLFLKKLKHIVNTNKKKFSELIIELTETWIVWMKQNKLSHDENLSNSERRKYAEESERLINREYEIVEEIDKFFE